MKKIILSTIAIALVVVSCNQKNKQESTDSQTTKIETPTPVSQSSFSIEEIISNYLTLKNALTKDDSDGAAIAGNEIVTEMTKIDMKSLNAEQMKSYMEVADDAKEHAEHIADNAGKIEHQREHFSMLSKDMNDLLITFGTKQKLYQDYCPMYDQGKSGYWISETKEINNPYFGSKMKKCGVVKKEF